MKGTCMARGKRPREQRRQARPAGCVMRCRRMGFLARPEPFWTAWEGHPTLNAMPEDILSRLFLATVFVAPFVALAIDMARSRYNPAQYVCWNAARLLTRLRWGARTVGEFPIPDGRGAIIVCNHRSSIDPFFVQTSLFRKAHWMVAKEYVEHPAQIGRASCRER